MEYKIPKSTIRSFIDVLKDTKRTLEIIKIETTKEKESVSTRFLISNQKIKSKEEEQEIKLEFDLCNLVLKIIDKLELAIDKLISSYNQKEFKEYIPFFDVIVACLGIIYFVFILHLPFQRSIRFGTIHSCIDNIKFHKHKLIYIIIGISITFINSRNHIKIFIKFF